MKTAKNGKENCWKLLICLKRLKAVENSFKQQQQKTENGLKWLKHPAYGNLLTNEGSITITIKFFQILSFFSF